MTKTYAQLTREIQALQASAEKLRASEIKAAIVQLNEMIATYGLTADDLRFPGAASASTGRRNGSSSASARSGTSTDAKYSDGQGRTWGGRGPRPAWLRQAISGGRSLESFETPGASATARSAQDDGAVKARLPALYGHPKTGQTWSGRGPKPAWLKQALKKRGTSVDDFRIPAQTTAPADAAAPTPSKGPRPQDKATTAKPAGATGKSPARKVGAKPKVESDAVKAPATAKKAPAKKAAAADAAPDAATSKAAKAAKKVAPKTSAKHNGKPSAKSASAPRKNLAASMAPPADAAPTPSTVPTAAPMPAAQSDSVEGRGDVAGT